MIICAGEALIDMLPRDLTEGTGFLPVAGGPVFNTAIALGRLGGKGEETEEKLAPTLEVSALGRPPACTAPCSSACLPHCSAARPR